MQIKERHQKIQLLRAEYIREKKRSQAKQFASFDASARSINDVPPEVISELTHEEYSELQEWLWAYSDRLSEKEDTEALKGLVPAIDSAAKAVRHGRGRAKFSFDEYPKELSRSLSSLKEHAPQFAACDLPSALRAATKAIEADQASTLVDDPAELIEALNGLKKALRKRGVRITPEKPKKQPKKPANEPELDGLDEAGSNHQERTP